MFETGAIQFFKKLDIGTFDLGDFLGNVLRSFFYRFFVLEDLIFFLLT